MFCHPVFIYQVPPHDSYPPALRSPVTPGAPRTPATPFRSLFCGYLSLSAPARRSLLPSPSAALASLCLHPSLKSRFTFQHCPPPPPLVHLRASAMRHAAAPCLPTPPPSPFFCSSLSLSRSFECVPLATPPVLSKRLTFFRLALYVVCLSSLFFFSCRSVRRPPRPSCLALFFPPQPPRPRPNAPRAQN
jgi:hypothetical protein